MKNNHIKDLMKAVKRKLREAEILLHGKSINYFKVVESKKKYKREKYKHDTENE